MSTDTRIEAIRNLADTPTPVATTAVEAPKHAQKLTGIDLIESMAIVGDGVKAIGAPLTAAEVKSISKIGHRAYRRAMLLHLDNVESEQKVKRGRKGKGKRRGRPPGSKNKSVASPVSNGPAKRRGRPPKNRTVTYEAPPQTATPPEASA